jgi:hypothetical protein
MSLIILLLKTTVSKRRLIREYFQVLSKYTVIPASKIQDQTKMFSEANVFSITHTQ